MKPTFLYVKQHKLTGVKYFGKTTKIDPYSYLGSGKRWTKHIKKHGVDHVVTLWTKLFTEETELIEFAKKFSEENNITNDVSWANLCPENGKDGGPRENNHFKIFNKLPRTEEHKLAISKARKGKASYRPNFKQSEESKQKISKTMTGRKRGPYKKKSF